MTKREKVIRVSFEKRRSQRPPSEMPCQENKPDPMGFIESRCAGARYVLHKVGLENALDYLIGEKFIMFLGLAERDDEWRRAIPAFVAEIRTLFTPQQIKGYLKKPGRRLRALRHAAKKWLLEGGDLT